MDATTSYSVVHMCKRNISGDQSILMYKQQGCGYPLAHSPMRVKFHVGDKKFKSWSSTWREVFPEQDCICLFFIICQSEYHKVLCIIHTFIQPKFDQNWGLRIIHFFRASVLMPLEHDCRYLVLCELYECTMYTIHKKYLINLQKHAPVSCRILQFIQMQEDQK